jgi:hypothetical protein
LMRLLVTEPRRLKTSGMTMKLRVNYLLELYLKLKNFLERNRERLLNSLESKNLKFMSAPMRVMSLQRKRKKNKNHKYKRSSMKRLRRPSLLLFHQFVDLVRPRRLELTLQRRNSLIFPCVSLTRKRLLTQSLKRLTKRKMKFLSTSKIKTLFG